MNEASTMSDELNEALTAASAMLEAGEDPHRVARWLHYYHRRCVEFESLLNATDRYLRFGLPEHELSRMRALVAHLRETAPPREGHFRSDETLPI